MQIDAIIFDFGNVLVNWDPKNLYETLFEDSKEMEYFLTNICSMEWHGQQDAGRSCDEATKILEESFPEHKEMIRRFYRDWESMFSGEIQENTALLPKLKTRGYRLFGLTNWPGDMFPRALRQFPCFEEFEGIVVSGYEKMIKPNREIYHLLLDRYQLAAKNSLFIDDRIENIEEAQRIGFHTIHYTNDVNLGKVLTDNGVL